MDSNPVETLPTLETLVDVLKNRLDQLVICLSHSWGGLEQVASNDSLDIGAQGLKVRVLCLEGSPTHEYLAHRKEVQVVPLQFRPRDYFDFKLRAELNHLINSGVNLIHCHQTSLLGSIVPWLWNRNNVVLFASRHIMNNHDKRDLFHRLVYQRVDALVVMSETLRRNVLATHAVKRRQVRVVNLGLDFDRFDPAKVDAKRQRQEWGADENTTVVGMVGRIDPAKGQSTFIKAAAGLLKTPGLEQKLKFVIVGEQTLGSGSTYLDDLKEMVRQFRIQDSVVFAGYKENIPEVMRAFDLFVMPSRQEAFGLVAIEAMAMECPIVISSGGSAREIVMDEQYGLIVVPSDAFDLQRQIRFLLEHPKLRVQMGERARAHVLKHYDRKVRLVMTLQMYEQMLRKRGWSI